MLIQITLGALIIIATILFNLASVWAMEHGLIHSDPWLRREPQRMKLAIMLLVAALWVMVQLTVGVGLWAGLFWLLGLFDTLETAIYFSLVSYTTLGFGDILLPLEWRLLAGLASANGLISLGLLTAFLVELVRQVRQIQTNAAEEDI